MTSWTPAGKDPAPPLEFARLVKPGHAKEFRSLTILGSIKPKQKPGVIEPSAPIPSPPQQTDEFETTAQNVAEFSEREAFFSEEINRLKNEIARLKGDHEATLHDLEKVLSVRLIENMQAEIRSSFHDLKEDLADGVTQVLRPFLAKAATEIAIRQFTELVETLVRDGKSAEMNIRAPEPFLQHLRQAFPEGSLHTQSADAGFEISLGKEVISSGLEKWLETIEAYKNHV